jgi:FkbM family methyltransferase
MNPLIKRGIQRAFRGMGLEITSQKQMQQFSDGLRAWNLSMRAIDKVEAVLAMSDRDAGDILKYLRKSMSQFGQDLFVLYELGYKRNGFFVEFGATNGVDLSNTHILEREFGWNGILAEPARGWHESLRRNRSCQIDELCVWKETGVTMLFREVGEFSTIDAFSGADGHAYLRDHAPTYQVGTISLNDLLVKYEAPEWIDYLSIDTEGSEYDILNAFDFTKHKFRVITCEHNYTDNRERVLELLAKNGYIRKYESVSACDDWYVHRDALS